MCPANDSKHHDTQNLKPMQPDVSHGALDVRTKLELKPGASTNHNERILSEQEIQRIKSENSVRKLPRRAIFGGNTFRISYNQLIYSGKYSIHHVMRESDKRFFSIKIDNRDSAMILRDEKIRSKLIGVDFPKIIHSERKSNIAFNVMEPLSMTLRNLIRGLSMRKEQRDFNSGVLLDIGRKCVGLLRKLHDNGILHGNINPHTFILPSCSDGKDRRADLNRGPLIIDFSHAIDCNEDPLYKGEIPATRFNSSIYPEDGGIYTKRDDMENLGYLLLYFANGHIGWEVRKRRDQLLFGKKCLSELNRNLRGIPFLIKNYLTYVRTIKWNATPDYELLEKCLVDKNLDIRAEMKARRARLKLKVKRKRKREASGNLERIDIGENAPTVQTEQPNTHKKRKVVHKSTIQYDRKAVQRGPEYFEMSLEMLPNIAVKFNDCDREAPSIFNDRTAMGCLALKMDSAEGFHLDLNQCMLDQSFTTCDEDNSRGREGDEGFDRGLTTSESIPDEGLNADANQRKTLFASESRSQQTTSRQYCEQIHQVPAITADNIQFHFPFLPSDSDDEFRHPWEQELGPLSFSR